MSSDIDDSPQEPEDAPAPDPAPAVLPLEPQTTTEVLAPADISRGYNARTDISVQRAALAEINRPFEESLASGDKERNTHKASWFKRFVDIWDGNTILRSEGMKAAFVYAKSQEDYAKVVPKIDELKDKLKVGGRGFEHSLDLVIKWEDHLYKNMKDAGNLYLKIMQEIRKTEFSDENHMHLSGFYYAWDAIKASLNRRLHGRPELDLLLEDIRIIGKGLAIYIGRKRK